MGVREGCTRTAIFEKLTSECLLGDESRLAMLWEHLQKARQHMMAHVVHTPELTTSAVRVCCLGRDTPN